MKPLFEILSIEDNPADAAIIRQLILQYRPDCSFRWVTDGLQASDCLFKRGTYASARTPDIVLLDLNIPKIEAKDVLRAMRQHPELKRVPVIVLTTSTNETDIAESYALGANAFISKPLDLDDLDKIVRNTIIFWADTVTLCPSRPLASYSTYGL